MTPLFSTVTVAFNAAATIRATIESVLAQTAGNREYLIVDGGSTDGTLDILRSYGDAIRWVSEPDKGIYDAMNKGIGLARGTWIHLLNADDTYAGPGVLAELLPRLDPACTNYADIEIVSPEGRRHVQSFPFNRLKLAYAMYLPHPGLVVHRDQYAAVGLYDTRYRIAADHDMVLRLLRAYPPRHWPMTLSVMNQGGASSRSLDTSAREFREVSVANGQPAALAWSLYGLKRLHWWLRA